MLFFFNGRVTLLALQRKSLQTLPPLRDCNPSLTGKTIIALLFGSSFHLEIYSELNSSHRELVTWLTRIPISCQAFDIEKVKNIQCDYQFQIEIEPCQSFVHCKDDYGSVIAFHGSSAKNW